MEAPSIVDQHGKPLRAAPRGRARAGGIDPFGAGSMFSGAVQQPYTAASMDSQEMGSWLPGIRSPDFEINQHRDRMVARSRDLVRNSGWASGGITRILDNTIGTQLRLSACPDWRALAYRFGIKACDATWANEFQRAAEALWRGYAENLGRWNDVQRRRTVGQMFRLSMRHKLIDGDSLALAYWLPERVGIGAADYATAFLLVDPDRLSNPYQGPDTKNLRGGIELTDDGMPLGAHIRKAHQNDWYNAIESMTWEFVPYEDEDGWRRVFHDFEQDRAEQHRGVGLFSSVLEHMKMLARYYGVELQAATIAATFGTFVKSPYDHAMVEDALGAEDDGELPQYQHLRAAWHKERPAMLQGARIPTLFPGEDIVSVDSKHPHTNFSAFAHEMLCVFAAASGVSVEQVTQDWSRTNYSSARAALMETWKTLMRRRDEFATNTASPMYALWLREAMERGELPLPAGAPEFIEASTAYARCKWLGPARGWVDTTKEPAGAVLRMEAGVSTLEAEAAEQGVDWEEVAQQRAIEAKTYIDLGLPQPKWVYGGVAADGQDANQPAKEAA